VIDEWLFLMKKAHELNEVPARMKKSKIFIQAFDVLEGLNWTREESDQYLLEQEIIGREERITTGARDEGLQRGLQQGLQQGLKQGLQEGALKEKEAIAIKLLQKKINIEDIVEATGLSVEQIKKLQK